MTPYSEVFALLFALLPTATVGLHGAELHALLPSTPHEVVRFGGVPASKASTLSLTVDTHGHSLIVDLKRHATLYHPDYEHIVVHPDGSVVSREPADDHCIYTGTIYDSSDVKREAAAGDAILSVCGGDVEGRLRIGETHDLSVSPHPSGDGSHLVMHHADWGKAIGTEEWSCGVDDEDEHADAHLREEERRRLEGEAGHGRNHGHGHDHHQHSQHDHFDQHVAFPAPQRRRLGVNPPGYVEPGNTNKYVEIIIVNDYARCQAFLNDGKTLSDMTTRSAGIMSVVHGLYQSGYTGAPNMEYSIHFSIRAQVSFAHGDPYTADAYSGNAAEVDVDSLLAKFGEWRVDSKASGAIPDHDNAQLFSGLDFGASTVGYAPVSAMCMSSATHGINMARVTSTDSQTAGTVAHELGHNWGM